MIKLRTQKILIEMPVVDSEPFISIIVQRIELDENGKELNAQDRYGRIYKQLSEVALEVYPYFEPAPNQVNSISVFGVADAIKNIASQWIIEKYGGAINANGDIIL